MNEDGLRETEKLMKEAAPSPSAEDLKVKVQRINVLNESEVGDLIESAVDVFGRIDYGVNCAGSSLPPMANLSCRD